MKLFISIIAAALSFVLSAQSVDDVHYAVYLSEISYVDAVKDINNKYEAVSYFTDGEYHIFEVENKTFIISGEDGYPYNVVTIVHSNPDAQAQLLESLSNSGEFEQSTIALDAGGTSHRFESSWCVVALLINESEDTYAITSFKK